MMKDLKGRTLQGWLLTCDQGREKQSVSEAMRFLAQFIESLYPAIQDEKLLFPVETEVRCVVFVGCRKEEVDVRKVVDEIMRSMQGRCISRFCHKILPVQKAFKAEFFSLQEGLKDLVVQQFSEGPVSYYLNFKSRNNHKFNLQMVLAELDPLVAGQGHWVDCFYPALTVHVVVNHHLMCLAVTRGFKQSSEYALKKYEKSVLPPLREHKPVPEPAPVDRQEWALYREQLEPGEEARLI